MTDLRDIRTVASCCVAMTPVLAQETVTLNPRAAAQIDQRGPARPTMRAFGKCVASRSRGRLAKLLALREGSHQDNSRSKVIFDRVSDPAARKSAHA